MANNMDPLEKASLTSQPMPAVQQVDHSASQAQPIAPPLQQPAPPIVAQPMPAPIADEPSDSLDEEWVRKAKAIVERTKSDPFLASSELGKMKAEYLRIRHNKQIKVAEDPQ